MQCRACFPVCGNSKTLETVSRALVMRLQLAIPVFHRFILYNTMQSIWNLYSRLYSGIYSLHYIIQSVFQRCSIFSIIQSVFQGFSVCNTVCIKVSCTENGQYSNAGHCGVQTTMCAKVPVHCPLQNTVKFAVHSTASNPQLSPTHRRPGAVHMVYSVMYAEYSLHTILCSVH